MNSQSLPAPEAPDRFGDPFSERPQHIVQFYEDELLLAERVAQFLAAAFRAGDPIILCATAAHTETFLERLGGERGAGDVEAACASGQIQRLDAAETLAGLMIGDAPDWSRFRAAVGGAIERGRSRRPDALLHAYGEMVNLLWRDGRTGAAIRLEEMWNELGRELSFSVLCAYSLAAPSASFAATQVHDVCRAHSHVLAPDGRAALESPDERLRQLGLWQERARALEEEIGRREELERALREALARETATREEAERSVRYNEMFAGILGHNLRNPLSAITTGATYIARVNSGEKATRAATRILSSAERMARMIDQLLDFTRVRVGGGLALSLTRFDLAEVLYRVKEELEAAHPESFVAVEARGGATGEWDYDRLLQVFSNLVGNAVQHGAAGCRVGLCSDGTAASGVTVSVHNGGVVSPQILPILFEPFRGGTRPQKARGLGLGLFITHQIVGAHGGRIEVESQEATGTTFRVSLPRIAPGRELRAVR